MRVLLFGKKSFSAAPREVALRLGTLVRDGARPGLEQAREWLVFAGQLEQAVLDAGGTAAVEAVTDEAAALFLDLRAGVEAEGSRAPLIAAIARCAEKLSGEAAVFRIPEGFAWYGLYPDGYAASAERWAKARPGRRVTVIGLRSIGTSLSAVVAGALRRNGADVRQRVTVRPTGHPFAREAALPPEVSLSGTAWIIVDEGPGLSGSSMAGVAEALQQDGVPPEDIAFFCGHGNGPGAQAGERERFWWRSERCWFTPTDALHPPREGGSLRLFGGFAAVNARLETLAEMKLRRQARLCSQGLALPAQRLQNGWIGIPEEGTPLTVADLDDGFIRGALARCIATAACPAEEEDACARAIARVGEAMAAYGVKDMQRFTRRAARETCSPALAGDGRLGPEHWARLAGGRRVKRDATGTDCTHDWAGPQPVLWDIAGAAAEWDMTAGQRDMLCAALARDHGIVARPFALAFHEAGYCALWLARARHDGDGVRAARYEARLHAALRRMEALA